MPELTALDWATLAVAAALIGFAKTAIGGVASVAVALFAFVLPARESTGAVLALLLVGDVCALVLYRRHADWAVLARLLPAVLPGLVLGAWFVARADQQAMQAAIGAVLAAMVAVQVAGRLRSARGGPALQERLPRWCRRVAPWAVGATAGFATMTANAAGPIATIYLLLAGLPLLRLLGTGAWFFFLVNLAKVPFSAGLDLMDRPTLLMDLVLVPALLAGALVGSFVARRIARRRFEDVTLVLTAVAAAALLV